MGKQRVRKRGVWFSERPGPMKHTIGRSARVGVSYAGPIWSVKPYRFTLDLQHQIQYAGRGNLALLIDVPIELDRSVYVAPRLIIGNGV